MTEISLRAYCDEVEELIKADSHDQAIAVCQHILRLYPRYLEAYRLLGQACLEKGMHSEAKDFFNRVLSADPEDFIAHVGLSMISEEKDPDEAIWQMERAFELAPDNAEVRKELRRLYTRRDKVEKPRLKPTRGGLGRLYARGGQLQQAIEEFKGVLEEDEERLDIQVALAEALWRNGQRLEASKLCSTILEKLPNCLKANLIWGEVWFHSDNKELKEEATAKLARAQALDPENTVAQELLGHLSPLSPQVKEIPRLEDVAVVPEELVEEPPSVAAPEITPVDEEALDLLRQAREKAPEPMVEGPEREPMMAEPAAEVTELAEAEEIPDWLQQLREMPEEPGEGIEEAPVGPQAVVEEGVEEPAVVQPPEVEEEEEIPDWLQQLRGRMIAEPSLSEEMGPPMAEEEEEIPDWLRQLREEPFEAQVSEPPTPEGLEAEEIEEIPAWLKEAEEAAPEEAGIEVEALAEEAPAGEAAVPEGEEGPTWLRVPHEEEVEEPMQAMELPEAPEAEVAPVEEVPPAEEEEVPPWLRILREEGLEEPSLEEIPAEEELAAEIEVPEAEVAPAEEAPPAEEEEEVPAWLRILREEGLEEPTLEEAPAEEELAVEMEVPEAEVPPAKEEEEVPAWLRILREEGLEEPTLEEAPAEEELAPEAEVAPAEEAPPVEEEEEVPAWLRILREEGLEEPSLEEIPAEEELAAEREVPEAEVAPTEEAPPAEEEEEVPAWLRILREEELEEPTLEEAPTEEEVVAEAEMPEAEVTPAEEKEMPAWLRFLREEELEEPSPEEVLTEEEIVAAVEVPEAEAAPVEEKEEIPAWLRILREEELEEPILEEIPAEEIVAEAEMPEAEVAPIEEAAVEEVTIETVEPPEVEEKVPIAAEAVAEEVPEEAIPLEAELVEAPSTIAEYQARLEIEPNDYDTRLSLARAYHEEGDREAAFEQYGRLIRSSQLLEMVIEDLERASQDAPDQSAVWQLLGDAYVKTNRLQKALEAYQKALKRL
jgi:tetratricopeptide (TPR) repeat protein